MGKDNNFVPREIPRPEFPKRAMVTGGMPYGNKELHFGHVGGMLVFADTYARFLRDRIGKENVIFVSGTDCYGSPIAEGWRKKVADGEFSGTLEEFVQRNHDKQKATLAAYAISPNLFGASGLGRTKEIHAKYTLKFLQSLYDKGQLDQITTMQFFDEKAGVFLNGRQVVGKCPVEGCTSEKGYADECDLGHQYMPSDLIDPVSVFCRHFCSFNPYRLNVVLHGNINNMRLGCFLVPVIVDNICYIDVFIELIADRGCNKVTTTPSWVNCHKNTIRVCIRQYTVVKA